MKLVVPNQYIAKVCADLVKEGVVFNAVQPYKHADHYIITFSGGF